MIPSLSDFMSRFEEESDRGAALISAAYLDESLRALIEGFLVENKKEVDLLLGSDKDWARPLGAFGARIRAAYCLGLVSGDEFHDLRLIQKIRNDFAHGLDTLSFDGQGVRERCDSLRIPGKRPRHPPLSSCDKFLWTVGWLKIGLERKLREVGSVRRQVPSEKAF